MEINDATAFVTGGSGGLGSVIAATLAKEGVNIAIGYRNSIERAMETKSNVEKLGVKTMLVSFDHSNSNSVDAAIDEIAGAFGGLDLLINNAGMASGDRSLPNGDLEALTSEIWDELMAANVRGSLPCSKGSCALTAPFKMGTYCQHRLNNRAWNMGRCGCLRSQ
jgi:3-oxoacyl-[acyl-carrier protein] reductase